MVKKSDTKLAFTCGDPAGVGPEIIAAWLAAHAADAPGVAVIGAARWLDSLKTSAQKISVGLEEFSATPGTPNGEGALVAWAAMERAAAGCASGEFSGVVTGPVSKAELARIGYPHPGQTEFFAAKWGGHPVMCFCGGKLRVALATWHVPLIEVGQLLGPQLLHRTIAAADQLCRAENISRPRIGVCGLNPHAGEDGLFGDEEKTQIMPAVEDARREGLDVYGPLPADTLFSRARGGEFDIVIAMYHDQGHVPVKTLGFNYDEKSGTWTGLSGVNVTVGLPFLRVSVDHGTAFDRAWKGIANPESMLEAIDVAVRMLTPKPSTP